MENQLTEYIKDPELVKALEEIKGSYAQSIEWELADSRLRKESLGTEATPREQMMAESLARNTIEGTCKAILQALLRQKEARSKAARAAKSKEKAATPTDEQADPALEAQLQMMRDLLAGRVQISALS